MISAPEQSRARVDASQKSAVLSKAVARAAEQLGLSRSLLARVLGLSPATVTRLYAGDFYLDAIVADETSARAWLGSDNRGLGGRPIDLISQTEGLVRVVHYLDASRAAV